MHVHVHRSEHGLLILHFVWEGSPYCLIPSFFVGGCYEYHDNLEMVYHNRNNLSVLST